MPIRNRGKVWLPLKCWMMLRMPLWPPWPPFILSRSTAVSVSRSSYIYIQQRDRSWNSLFEWGTFADCKAQLLPLKRDVLLFVGKRTSKRAEHEILSVTQWLRFILSRSTTISISGSSNSASITGTSKFFFFFILRRGTRSDY